MANHAQTITSPENRRPVARARRLEYLTVAWNVLEAVVALLAGVIAGSVALVGFGLDSIVETASAMILLWRLRTDLPPHDQQRLDRIAHRLVGVCFLVLAAYVLFDAVQALLLRSEPERTVPGILVACLSVVVMPLLARAKRKVAAQIGSKAMHSDSRQTDFCAYLSAILLAGLLLNWWLHWWWADPVAALVMVPIIAREGVQGLRGKGCEDCGCVE